MFRARPADARSRPASHAVVEELGLDPALHLERARQLLVERKTGVEVAEGQLDVGDAVELHGCTLTHSLGAADPRGRGGLAESAPRPTRGRGAVVD